MNQSTKAGAIQKKLNNTLKDIYRLALNADEQIEALKEEDKGKFAAVFHIDSGFQAQADHFLPYLIEVSENVQALSTISDDEIAHALQPLLHKIQMMSQVLNKFHAIA